MSSPSDNEREQNLRDFLKGEDWHGGDDSSPFVSFTKGNAKSYVQAAADDLLSADSDAVEEVLRSLPRSELLAFIRRLEGALANKATAPVVRTDWRCEAGTEACPGDKRSLRKDWICDSCGRRAHAPTRRDR